MENIIGMSKQKYTNTTVYTIIIIYIVIYNVYFCLLLTDYCLLLLDFLFTKYI